LGKYDDNQVLEEIRELFKENEDLRSVLREI
jgi:hypothetical protein